MDDSQSKNNGITLELGDIIEIVAPSNPDIHEMTALIQYIDENKITVVNVTTLKHYQLNINDNGEFSDESITEINLLSRSDEKGYARQNGLLPKTWIDIHFGGEIPLIITGEITNLEEDMIEITTFPDMQVLYIDFEYKGIPENIPLEKIVIREKPASVGKLGSLSKLQSEEGEENVEEEPSVTYTDNGESIIRIPENIEADETVKDAIQNDLFADADTIIFGDKLGAVKQYVEVPEGEQRYDIETQVNNFMDELLSTIPNGQRTVGVLDNLHLLIERFKQLRSAYSEFDENENVSGSKVHGAFYKPLVRRVTCIRDWSSNHFLFS
jgi:hypothetical protein